MSEEYKIVEDSLYGFKHLFPRPDIKNIDEFYKTKYYEMSKDGSGRPDHIARMLSSNAKDVSSEEAWLKRTLHSDVAHYIKKYSSGNKVLEVGCGIGNLLCELERSGFDVCGLDSSIYATEIAKMKGCKNVHSKSLKEFYDTNIEKFDAIILVNVLEHVPYPYDVMNMVKGMLHDNGIVIIVVPNDFTRVQALAKKRLSIMKEWWLAIPDHINYFNYSSLNKFMQGLGFKNCCQRGDFPIELFLLMGFDYTSNKKLGKRCHDIRVKFEMFIPGYIRRLVYSMLAKFGVGRNCYYVGRICQ